MGWSNYILVKKDKIALEVSRECNDGNDDDIINRIQNFQEDEESIPDSLANTKMKDITLGEIKRLYEAYEILTSISSTSQLLYLLLKHKYGEMEIVHESNVPKDYKKIMREYE